MKTNSTLISNKPVQLLIAFLFPLFAFAQIGFLGGLPDYDFRNPVLVSGTALKAGAQYRFSNVRANTDALVRIVSLTNLAITNLDGPGGYIEAFQPIIEVPAYKVGFAEFQFTFVTKGTIIPAIQPLVPATPIDVDGMISGGKKLFEYDQIKMGVLQLSDFNMSGGELLVTLDGGGWITGKNVAAIDYPGIDTSAKSVMFTVFNSGITGFSYRVGADNQTGALQSRLRSVYFKRFNYPFSSLLSDNPLLSFNGVKKKSNIELNWSFIPSTIKSAVLEKATNSDEFIELPELYNTECSNQQFVDYSVTGSTILYRLKMTSYNGRITYSNILAFKGTDAANTQFRIYPTAIQSDLTMQFRSVQETNAVLQLVDVSGRIMHVQNVILQAGINNVRINGFGEISKGHYIVILRSNDAVYSQKVLKQ